MEALSHPELKLSETVPDFFGEHLDFRPLAPKDFSPYIPDDDALILSFWLLGLSPSSLGLQELNFPGTGLSI